MKHVAIYRKVPNAEAFMAAVIRWEVWARKRFYKQGIWVKMK